MRKLARRIANRARQEDGFTIVEIMIAALILAVGVTATLVTLSTSSRFNLVSERHTELAHQAQNELERVLSLPYSQVALTGTSSSWSGTAGAYTYVGSSPGSCPSSSSGPAPTYQPDHSNGGSASTEPLVINGCSYTMTVNGTQSTVTPNAGTIAPVTSWSAPLQSGTTISGSIYDFVTWTADPSCSQTSTPGSNCDTSKDYKRVTIVVTMNGATQPSNPTIVSGYVTPPSSGKNPLNGGGTTCKNSQGQAVSCTSNPCNGCNGHQYFPTDCTYTNTCSTGPPCSGNTLHDTLFTVGLNAPTPDQFSTSPPTESCTTPPCFATDVGCTGAGSGQCTSGCGLPLPSSTSCTTPPTANSGAHSWVTPTIPSGVTWNLNGTGTATLYLESSNGSTIQATGCVGLYVVPGGVLGSLTGNLLGTQIGTTASVNVQATAGVPTPVTFDFNTNSGTYAVASLGQTRIEVVLWITAASAPVNVVYDQAGLQSQVTINTLS